MKIQTGCAALGMVASIAAVTNIQAETLLYVPTGDSNEIIVIDPSDNKITKRIPELENAHGLAATPDGEYLIAGSQLETGGAEQATAAKPEGVSQDEHEAHHRESAVSGKSFLSVVNVKHARVARRIPVEGRTHHIAVSPKGDFAVAVHTTTGRASIVDLNASTVIKRIPTGTAPNYAVFDRNGDFVYVSNAGSGTVTKINTATWDVAATLSVGKGPEHMEFSPDGKTLFVANVFDNTVSAVTLADGKVAATYKVGKAPHGVSVSSDGRYLFVSGKDDNSLARIDLKAGETVMAAIAPEPYHVSYIRGLDKLYVSSRAEPKIWVVNPQSLVVETTIDIGSGVAHQMVEVDSK